MRVIALFAKPASGAPMRPRSSLNIGLSGIDGQKVSSPLRQLLLLSTQTVDRFRLSPGELRENVLLGGDDVHELTSGAVLLNGRLRLRLNFHCEPCGKLPTRLRASELRHRRGVLASVVCAGSLRVGDDLSLTNERLPPIPYDVPDRIIWYLAQQSAPVSAAALVDAIGLPRGYCRALPSLIRRNSKIQSELIEFAPTTRRNFPSRNVVSAPTTARRAL